MVATVLVAAAVTILAVAADDEGEDSPAVGGAALDAAGAGLPPAPWRAGPVPRPAVPAPFPEAWDRAANRAGCALLFPLDGGPELGDAEAAFERTPGDRGWDIFLTGDGGSVEVLALFERTTPTTRPPATPAFTRRWADGSAATYFPDVGNAAPGTYDVEGSPFEAVLTLPDQSCAYRIYDTLGKAHLEALFDRLRLMAP